jgi:hypothetical protein
MAGLLPVNPRQGNRLEYLANYILSGIGTAVPVLRTEDVGIDFFCALGKNADVGITIADSYAVQLKSGANPCLTLGGKTSGGTWRDYEINWFLNLEFPLFFGVPHKAEKRLDLYSTSLVRWIAAKPKLPYQVKVLPGAPGKSEGHTHPDQNGIDSGVNHLPDNCDGKIYEYHIGPPIISCTLDDLNDDATVVRFQKILRDLIRTELLNAIYRKLGLPYWTWVLEVETNMTHTLAYAYAGDFGASRQEELLAEIVPFICALAMGYQQQGDAGRLSDLKGIVGMLPKERVPEGVRAALKELFD